MPWSELLTIFTLGSIVIAAIFKMPPDSAEKVALTLGGVLGGYLTKTAVDFVKAAMNAKPETVPDKPIVTKE